MSTICFICDQNVASDKVILATSNSTHSKVSLPEKISQLIGDDYVVAVTEQDIVCNRCATLLNHMDKLECELDIVKKALAANIMDKYNIVFDAELYTSQDPIVNGDSIFDIEEEITHQSSANFAKSKFGSTSTGKNTATAKPAKPIENMTKIKIYKCGFCSYQSKELANVRMHMKNHMRTKPDSGDLSKYTNPSSTFVTEFKNPQPPNRKKVFRCQVCSASFDDRSECLDHISRDHTAAGRKSKEVNPLTAKFECDLALKRELTEVLSNGTNSVVINMNMETQVNSQDSTVDMNYPQMDTDDPPTIGIYICESCPRTFNNVVNLGKHTNEHIRLTEGGQIKMNSDQKETHVPNFTQMPLSGAEKKSMTGDSAEDDIANDESIGLDIEAMIAALHSESPEREANSMPSI